MESEGKQPLINNNYPNLESNNRFEQNQGWNSNQPNQGWNNNQSNQANQNQGWNNNQPNRNQGWNNNQPNQNPRSINNQGFQPNQQAPIVIVAPVNHGQQPYIPGQPMPMPNVNAQRLIIVQQHYSQACRMCGYDGLSTWKQNPGCAAYGWCVCLFCFFWPLCWLPFCMDSCQDIEVVCSRCGQAKALLQADCC